MAGILEGTKVIEMGHLLAVPAAAAILADWGADVIKLEPPGGEMARGIYTLPDREDPAAQLPSNNWYFQVLNRNKKGLALNLKTKAGRKIAHQLVRETDVFVSNYELSTIAELGMDYETLKEINPGLVYASLTGYGTVGPDKDLRGLDWTAGWTRSGIMHMNTKPGSPPSAPLTGMIDRVTGFNMVGGICAALLHKEKTGQGQQIEYSLYHTGVWALLEDIQSALVGRKLRRHNRKTPPSPTMNSYRTKDKKWFWISGLGSTWETFCKAIDRPDWVEDTWSAELYGGKPAGLRSLVRQLEGIFASKTKAQWDKIFRKHDLVYGWAESPAEVVRNKQAITSGFFTSLQHPDEDMRVVSTPTKFCQNPASVRTPAPETGQHTEEMLLALGYGWEDIAGLKEQGVIM